MTRIQTFNGKAISKIFESPTLFRVQWYDNSPVTVFKSLLYSRNEEGDGVEFENGSLGVDKVNPCGGTHKRRADRAQIEDQWTTLVK